MTAIAIDVRQLDALADRLGLFTGEKLEGAGVSALNEVAERAEPNLRNSIRATINLRDPYLRARMALKKATPGKPEAVISAAYRHTPLGRYDALIRTQPVKHPSRSKGNPALGIPAGRKPAALSVSVTLGQRKELANKASFLVAKHRDSDGNPMVFTRKLEHERYPIRARYGPSVYQLFRVARDTHLDEISTDLQLTLLAEAEAALEEVFE